jgi:hypothetical protein
LGAAVLSQSVQERFPYQDGEGQCAHEKVAWSGRKKPDLPVTLWLSFDTAKCSCATMGSGRAVIAVLAPVCAANFHALPDVAARTASLVADKDNPYKMREAFPATMITLPGKSYPDSDLTAACAGLILAPPKTAELKQ